MIIVLYCFINLALHLKVSTWILKIDGSGTVDETFDTCDVTARSDSHLMTSSLVRCLQCILLCYFLLAPCNRVEHLKIFHKYLIYKKFVDNTLTITGVLAKTSNALFPVGKERPIEGSGYVTCKSKIY